MPRNVYGPDHEAFRELRPRVRRAQPRSRAPRSSSRTRRSAARSGSRPASRACSGSRSPRSTAARRPATTASTPCWPRSSPAFNAAVSSCFGIHADVVRALPRRPRHRGAEAALAARHVCTGEIDHRHRDDRARRRLRPRGAEDHRGARRRRLDPQRLQDLHHQRLPGRPRDRRRPHRPGARAPRASPCSWSRPAWRASSRGRKLDKVGQEESDTAELFFTRRARARTPTGIGEVDRGFIAMMQRLPQERIGAAVSNIAHAAADPRSRPSSTPRSARRSASRSASFQHNKFLLAELRHQDRGHPGVRRRLRRRRTPSGG